MLLPPAYFHILSTRRATRFPPPLPAGAEAPRSARNPRSPLISLLIFAGGGVVNTTSVLQTACQEAKTSTTESGIRPRWGVLEFLNPFQL